MSKVSTEAPDPTPSSPARVIRPPSVLDRTERQVQMLVGVVQALQGHTISFTEPGDTKAIAEGVERKAAETTVAALHQLDNILDDQTRWGLERDPYDRAFEDMLDQNRRLVRLQTRELAARLRPSARLGAVLVPDGTGMWTAVLPETGETLGRGTTPARALQDFDRSFFRLKALSEREKKAPTRRRRKAEPPSE